MSALPGGGASVVPLRPQDAVPTRDRLLQAARAVVEQHGYGGASVAAIAARAEVATGTLYRHFGSKAELFVEIFRDVCGRELDAMRAAVDGSAPDPIDRVLAPLDVFARRALQNRELAWALLAEPVDPLVDEVRMEYRRTYRDLLAGLVRDAVDDGALPTQDADVTAAALVGAVGEALVGPVSATTDAVARSATDDGAAAAGPDAALLHGLRTLCRRAIGAPPAGDDRPARGDGGR